MSTRQLLNMTMGAFAMLLLAAIGVVFSTTGSHGDQNAPIELAVRQQVLVQDLTRQAAALAAAEDRDAVTSARANLSRTIMQFDRNLTALMHGGSALDANGQTVVIERMRNDMARIALEDGAHLWLETGLPLADLAAGEFSVFSAAGQKATKGLQNNNVELMQHMGTAANSLRMGIHARSTVAGIARWSALGLGGVLVGLGFLRRKVLATENIANITNSANSAPFSRTQHAPATDSYANVPVQTPQPLSRRPGGVPNAAPGLGTFASPVNFDSVNASVDQMSVDMNTIAGSTEKMRLAIDSVGNALQGMLYSLNEMSQDTAEGHKIVRNANNAASFTADTAGDLAASAREMAEVVSRVTQLAHSTKMVATQIDGEAIHTGKTGEAFTSVVAGEVKGLSMQTNRATMEIEETVASILQTARQYEEAIGQIIKNVSAINKVSQNLGQLMLHPPTRVEPGTPLPPAAALAPTAAALVAPVAPAAAPAAPAAPEEPEEPAMVEAPATEAPEPIPEAPVAPAADKELTLSNDWGDDAPAVEDDPIVSEPTSEEVAAETSAAIEDAAEEPETATADGGSNENVFMLGGRDKKPNALNIPAPPPMAEEPVAESPVAEDPVAEDPVPEDPAAEGPAAEEPAANEAPKEEPAAEPLEAPQADGGSSANVYMLGGAKKAPATAEPAMEPETPPEPAPVATSTDSENVFMLNKPKTAGPEPRDVEEVLGGPVAEDTPDEAPEAEAPAPEADAEEAKSSENVFMLNKPK